MTAKRWAATAKQDTPPEAEAALSRLAEAGVRLPRAARSVSDGGWTDPMNLDDATLGALTDLGFESRRAGAGTAVRVCGALVLVRKADLDAALSALLKRTVKGYTSQDGTSYEYGHSRVYVRGLSGGDASRVRGARARAEGGAGRPGELPLGFEFRGDEPDPVQSLAAWAAAVLSTGRTVECGRGVNVHGLRAWAAEVRGGGEVCEDLEHLVDEIDGAGGPNATGVPRRGLVLQPDYQRGYVWTDRQAELFVGHWLEGGEVPKIYVHRANSEEAGGPDWHKQPSEVVDGQQRLKSLLRWVRGEILAETASGARLAYADTNEVDRRALDVRICYVSLPRAARLRLYIRLNRGGTAHSEADVERARALLAAETPA